MQWEKRWCERGEEETSGKRVCTGGRIDEAKVARKNVLACAYVQALGRSQAFGPSGAEDLRALMQRAHSCYD